MASGEPAEEEENIVEGKLGLIFSEAEPFSNTAALNILSQVFQARNMDVVNAPERVRKTWDYLKQFNVQGNAANATALQGALQATPLNDFERACVSNLNPHSAEEAKALLPSLDRLANEEVTDAVERVLEHNLSG